jgi:starch phosphorylase
MSTALKDPVCGMAVQPGAGFTTSHNGQSVSFCSEFCRSQFLASPERYSEALATPSYEEAKDNRRIAYFSMEVAVGARPTAAAWACWPAIR